MFLLYQLTTIWLIIICFHLKSNFTFSFFNKHVFYLSLFLKRKLHIKVIEVIPLIVFFFPCLPRSLSFIICFISFILSFILFHFIIINFKLHSPPLFFPTLSSLYLTFQEVDMTALKFAGLSFPHLSSYHPSYYFLPSNPSSSYTYPNSILRLT